MNVKKLFVSLMLVVMLCSASQADIVYTTSTGNLGLISISRSDETLNVSTPSVKYSGIGTNPLAASYWNGSEARLIVIDRTTDLTTSSGDKAFSFNPSDLTSPFESQAVTLTGAYNIQSAISSYNGKSIFTASRENGSIIEFSTEDFERGHSYTYAPESGDTSTPKAISLLSDYHNIYALINVNSNNSAAMKFDGQLKTDIEGYARINLEHEASSIGWLSNGRIAAAHTEGIDILEGSQFKRLLSSDEPVKTFCLDSGHGFYFATQKLSEDVYTCDLYHYDNESKDVTPLLENKTGSSLQTIRDEGNNALAVIIGRKIYLYDMLNDNLVGEYDSSALNGEPVSVSVTYASGDDGKRSSGCEVFGSGIILLTVCLFLVRRK
ncbi:MAG: hypothetical protein IJU48_02010 [Synergistaceae bacterium]|nr:hypothetical protein [Synergistaceae bacterium]